MHLRVAFGEAGQQRLVVCVLLRLEFFGGVVLPAFFRGAVLAVSHHKFVVHQKGDFTTFRTESVQDAIHLGNRHVRREVVVQLLRRPYTFFRDAPAGHDVFGVAAPVASADGLEAGELADGPVGLPCQTEELLRPLLHGQEFGGQEPFLQQSLILFQQVLGAQPAREAERKPGC